MSRKLHRWISLLIAIPFSVVVVTGFLLQVKRWVPAIQPPSAKSERGGLRDIPKPLGWDGLLLALTSVPAAQIKSWADVKQIDVRPALGTARARNKHGFEVQVDMATGKVLSAAQRYSSLLVEIHEGAFFGDWVRNGIFVPTAIAMLILTATGIWLLFLHYGKRKTWG